MKSLCYSCLIVISIVVTESTAWAQQCLPFIASALMEPMPEAVANNAVCGGLTNGGKRYVYSFAGIDSTKNEQGIHLKSWRYDVAADAWEAIPPLPDTMGKVAAGASHIDGVVYIVGGYHVFANGGEVSSARIHRYDCSANAYLGDGADLPFAIDDHVQAVWNDSLIYVITGWRNTGNLVTVQIYNPSLDTWMLGTPVPNNNSYKSFGASGVIDGNTIYYFGGASTGINFPIQPVLRIGQIDPNNPLNIAWSDSVFGVDTALYRAAAVMTDAPTWLGGSRVTYNYDGIAYDGSGAVSPSNVIQQWNGTSMALNSCDALNMDYRGVANFPMQGEVYLAGGMEANQRVSQNLFRLQYTSLGLEEAEQFARVSVFPNPAQTALNIEANSNIATLTLYDSMGKRLMHQSVGANTTALDLSALPYGLLLMEIDMKNGRASHQKVVHMH